MVFGALLPARLTTRRSLRRVLLSQTDAFEPLVRAHQGAVRAFLRRLTGETGRADELAQDTFLRAYEIRDRLSQVRSVRSWLYKIAYRRFLDDRRKQVRRDALRPEIKPETSPSKPDLAMDIAKIMDRLPPERRACAMLSLALGHSHRDIVEITGLPLGTVKSHISRAKSVLQEGLYEYR